MNELNRLKALVQEQRQEAEAQRLEAWMRIMAYERMTERYEGYPFAEVWTQALQQEIENYGRMEG